MSGGELLMEAFTNGKFVQKIEEHEGATHTYIYETPRGHVGVSVGIATRDGPSVSVSEWEKQQHHELDRWVWVRSDN